MPVQRLSGLVSGMDYESFIKQLMKAESSKLERMKQQRQLLQWKEEAYRDLNADILALKNSAGDMRLQTTYNKFKITSSDESTVSVNATSAAANGTYKILVKQIATAAEKTSTGTVTPPLQSTADIDFSSALNLSGKDFNITFDGTQKNISWGATEGTFNNIDDLVASLQAKVDDAFGANQITVSKNGDRVVFDTVDTVYKGKITLSNGTETANALTDLKFSNGVNNKLNTNTELKDLKLASGESLVFDAVDNKLKFSINGRSYEFEKTDTLEDVFDKINNDTAADLIMGYDSAKDSIYIRRKSTGSGKDINFSEDGITGNLGAAIGFGATKQGNNAIIDFTNNSGVTTQNIERANNNFTLMGLNITLSRANTEEQTINVSRDVDGIYEKIKSFINSYNETITKINNELEEKRDRNYQPLTDDERDAMSDDQIEKWEAKVKEGLLRQDSTLQSVVRELRNTVTNAVKGLSSNMDQLSEIGIKTGSYFEGGILHIDEAKLKEAIANSPDKVMSLFTNTPDPLAGTELSGTVDVDNKDINVSLNGSKQTIILSGSYDVSTSDGRSALVKELNEKLQNKFGYSQIVASFTSDNKIIFSSPKGYDIKLNSGTSNDGLAVLGFTDGAVYEADKKGVMSKLYDKLTNAVDKIIDKAGTKTGSSLLDNSILGKQISDLQDRIDDEADRLLDVEDRYYAQFTAMESYLSQMNAQSAWLAQQLVSK